MENFEMNNIQKPEVGDMEMRISVEALEKLELEAKALGNHEGKEEITKEAFLEISELLMKETIQ